MNQLRKNESISFAIVTVNAEKNLINEWDKVGFIVNNVTSPKNEIEALRLFYKTMPNHYQAFSYAAIDLRIQL